MRLRLAYPDALVEVVRDEVLFFRRKLLRASLSEVLNYAAGKDAILPRELKEVSFDIALALNLLNTKKHYKRLTSFSGVA